MGLCIGAISFLMASVFSSFTLNRLLVFNEAGSLVVNASFSLFNTSILSKKGLNGSALVAIPNAATQINIQNTTTPINTCKLPNFADNFDMAIAPTIATS